MGSPSDGKRKKAKTARGASAGVDRITALPLELRARIASFLHFQQVFQLSVDGPPYGHVTVDAPELIALDMICSPGCTRDYKSLTLHAPKLRLVCWYSQFAERVHIDVGRPGSVKVGKIEFMSVYLREMKYYREQMMRMLEGLLPNVQPESVGDVVRHYLTLEKCPDSDDDEDAVEEKLTCDLSALMSRGL